MHQIIDFDEATRKERGGSVLIEVQWNLAKSHD